VHWLVYTLLIVAFIYSICSLTLVSLAFKNLIDYESTGEACCCYCSKFSSSCSGSTGKFDFSKKLLQALTQSLYSGSLEKTEIVEASVFMLFWEMSYFNGPSSWYVDI